MKYTVLFLLLAGAAFCQTEPEKPSETKFYKLDFVLKETEAGKVVNTRNYTMNIAQMPPFNSSSVRTGDRVPVPTGKDGQVTFMDVGVNIDCRLLRLVDSQMIVQVTADVSSIATAGNPPVINQTRWNAGATVPFRKPTVLFVADGASTKRQMLLELTVTPVP